MEVEITHPVADDSAPLGTDDRHVNELVCSNVKDGKSNVKPIIGPKPITTHKRDQGDKQGTSLNSNSRSRSPDPSKINYENKSYIPIVYNEKGQTRKNKGKTK